MYEIVGKRSIKRESRQMAYQGPEGWETGLTAKEWNETFWGYGKSLYLHYTGGCATACICQNSNCTHKVGEFY